MIAVLTYIAIICGGLLLLLLLLGMLGGLDLDVDFDGGDADGGVGWFKGALTFLSTGAWVGRVLLLSDANPWLSLLVGAVAGAVGVWLLGLLTKWLLSQEENVNWTAEDALRQSGKVYLRIPAGGQGIVRVNVRGGLRELPARSRMDRDIPTGATITVEHLDPDGVVIVALPTVTE